MNQLTFSVLLLLLAISLCFAVISSLYGAVKAYTFISWIPITIFVLTYIFLKFRYVRYFEVMNVYLLYQASVWTGFIQSLPGIILIIRANLRDEDWVIPTKAALLSALPFLVTK